jgi:lysozyme
MLAYKEYPMPSCRLICLSGLSTLATLATLAACGGPLPDENAQRNDNLSAASSVCPGSTKVYGLDVSYYDGTINWSSVKGAGKEFAIIRVADGTGYHDPNFVTNWNGAKAAGLTVGAYQFFRPTEDPTAQAELVLSKLASVGFGAGDIPPVLDVEVMDGASAATVAANVNTWLQYVKAHTGRLPVMYSSARVWNELGNPKPSPLPYLWDAQWTTSCPNLPPEWGRLRFWQYSATGTVPGIAGSTADLDLYNGSLTELRGL